MKFSFTFDTFVPTVWKNTLSCVPTKNKRFICYLFSVHLILIILSVSTIPLGLTYGVLLLLSPNSRLRILIPNTLRNYYPLRSIFIWQSQFYTNGNFGHLYHIWCKSKSAVTWNHVLYLKNRKTLAGVIERRINCNTKIISQFLKII